MHYDNALCRYVGWGIAMIPGLGIGSPFLGTVLTREGGTPLPNDPPTLFDYWQSAARTAGGGTSYLITIPAGAQAGQLLIALVVHDGTSVHHTWPAGWTKFPSTIGLTNASFGWKIATGGGGSVSPTFSASRINRWGACFAFANAGTIALAGEPIADADMNNDVGSIAASNMGGFGTYFSDNPHGVLALQFLFTRNGNFAEGPLTQVRIPGEENRWSKIYSSYTADFDQYWYTLEIEARNMNVWPDNGEGVSGWEIAKESSASVCYIASCFIQNSGS
jgi:hypothetical protein